MVNRCSFVLGAKVFFAVLVLSACSQHKPDRQEAQGRFKTYKGTVNAYVDAGLAPIFNQQKEMVEFYNDSVKVNAVYSDEAEAIKAYRKSKAGILFIGRALDSAELANMYQADTFVVRQTPVAYDAVAIIGNKNYDDRNLSLALLKKYLTAQSKTADVPTLVFDKESNAIIKFMWKKLDLPGHATDNMFGAKTPEEVVDYVRQNQNAIGFIPFNFLSDTDNERVRKINEQIKILSLHAVDSSGRQVTSAANQSDIAEGTYPFIRTLTATTHYGFADDLDWLLVYFLSKDKASKIFLKDGLVPVKRTEREIIVNTDGLKAQNK